MTAENRRRLGAAAALATRARAILSELRELSGAGHSGQSVPTAVDERPADRGRSARAAGANGRTPAQAAQVEAKSK